MNYELAVKQHKNSKRQVHLRGDVQEVKKMYEGMTPFEGKIFTLENTKIVFRGKEIPYENMLIKNVDNIATAENILEKYNWLKKRGFPVVPKLRIDSTGNIVMTDITQGGKHLLYDKHNPYSEDKLPFHLDRSYVENMVRNLVLQGYENGITLHSDAFCILVDPDTKKIDVVILDIGMHTTLGVKFLPYRFQEKAANVTRRFLAETYRR